MYTRLAIVGLVASSLVGFADDKANGPRNQELKVLAPLVGEWEGEYVIGTNTNNKMRVEQRTEWILDGWHLASHSTSRNDQGEALKAMMVIGYDKSKQRYTRSFYFTGGGSYHETGSFDPIAKVFTFRDSDSETGETRTSTVKIEDNDTLRWTITVKKLGESPLEIQGVNRRKK